MTTKPQSTTEPTLEPCPLPEPLRSVAQECCSCCETGTITNGYGVEAVRPPRRSFDGSKHSMNWTHDLVRGGCGYGCTASALYELNARVSASVAPTVDRAVYSELIHIAAELARGEGFLSTCAEDMNPRLKRADILKTAERQEERLKDWAYRVRQVANKLSSAAASPVASVEQSDAQDRMFAPPAEDKLHIAICNAVQSDQFTASDILRQALIDYQPTKLTRTELIRVQQRSGSDEVSAIMVSTAPAPSAATQDEAESPERDAVNP